MLSSFAVPGGGYGYTGAKIEDLGAIEYTLVQLLIDESGSTSGFGTDMENCIKEIVQALQLCPRKDNLLFRVNYFNNNIREIHGFMPLDQIKESDYAGTVKSSGSTALFDSTDRVLSEMMDYGSKLGSKKFLYNGIIFVVTDGMDTGANGGSTLTPKSVHNHLAKIVADETMESMMSILIGINPDQYVQDGLKRCHAEMGFTQYVPMTEATKKSLAKLAKFVSQSVTSASAALGTGGPSKTLVF